MLALRPVQSQQGSSLVPLEIVPLHQLQQGESTVSDLVHTHTHASEMQAWSQAHTPTLHSDLLTHTHATPNQLALTRAYILCLG